MINRRYVAASHSTLLAAALLAGASYWPMSHTLPPGAVIIVWKGVGVALLALWAILRSGSMIGVVLAFGALGDVLLETAGQTIGALAFLAGHILAIIFYRKMRRPGADGLGIAIFGVIMIMAWIAAGPTPTLIYATGLSGMTGAAVASCFPRRYVALGAAMFAASDLLIFARAGLAPHIAWAGVLVWPLYFIGQALIAWGVVGMNDKKV
ncbi:MAG: lysoplasmalogenase [Sphingomonas sp.]